MGRIDRTENQIAAGEIVAAVIAADDLIVQRLLPVIAEHAITPEIFRALRHLCVDPETRGMTVGDLGKVMASSPPATTRIVDKLVTEGLAYRRADEMDRRRVLVAVSASGRSLWSEILAALGR